MKIESEKVNTHMRLPHPPQTDARTEMADKVPAKLLERSLAKEDKEHSVGWDGDADTQNPKNWSSSRKWFYVALMSAITFDTSMAATMFAPGIPAAQQEFGDYNQAEGALLVSIFTIGLAIGPLFLSPASELYGRLVTTHVSNVVFLVAAILCAVAVNIPMLLVFRLIMGTAAAVPFTIGGRVITDLMEKEARGRAMMIWSTVGQVIGPVISPIAGGYLTLKVGWRWINWLTVILSAILTAISFIFLRETYAPRLLSLKAKRLRKHSNNTKWRSEFESGQLKTKAFQLAVTRPAKLLVRSPIVLILSLFMAVAYSYMYVLFITFPMVFEGVYGFNSGEAGLAYLGLGVGFVVGQVSLGKFYSWYLAGQKTTQGATKPENRLPPLVLGSFIIPIGLFWYGWTAQFSHSIHWIVPIIGTALCGLGILFVFMAVQLYLVEVYPLFAASALAAATVLRSVFATCIPLAGPALYARLGLGWGNSLLGFLALCFAPLSLALLRYGERIRKSPRFEVIL